MRPRRSDGAAGASYSICFAGGTRTLDTMTQITKADTDIPSDWQATASGNAQLMLSKVSAGRVSALRMDFDFKGGGGFVVARRAFNRAMPKEYAVHFRLRGRGSVNNLELKLIDATGQNVWRHVKKDLRPPARWQGMTVESREIEFAWGPSSGSAISNLGSIEFAIVAGEGGKGTMWIADLEIEDCSPSEAPRASASSALPGFEAASALLGAGWKPASRRSSALACDRFDQASHAGRSGHRLAGPMRPRAAFAFAVRTAAVAGKRCTPQSGRAADAATCICPDSRPDSCGSNSMSRRRARPCVCNRSNSRVRSTPSGTASPNGKHAAGIRDGCIANRVRGRRSAPRTARIARS